MPILGFNYFVSVALIVVEIFAFVTWYISIVNYSINSNQFIQYRELDSDKELMSNWFNYFGKNMHKYYKSYGWFLEWFLY